MSSVFTFDRLCLIIDCHPILWGMRSAPHTTSATTNAIDHQKNILSFTMFIDHLLLFIDSYLLLSRSHRLSLIIASPLSVHQLFPTPPPLSAASDSALLARLERESGGLDDWQKSRGKLLEKLQEINENIVKEFREKGMTEKHNNNNNPNNNNNSNNSLTSPSSSHRTLSSLTDIESHSLLAGALSKALAYFNRRSTVSSSASANANGASTTGNRSRILMLSISGDAEWQYVSMMNNIFAAEKLNITIDAIIIGNKRSAFLQQAAFMTKGVYKEFNNDMDNNNTSNDNKMNTIDTTSMPGEGFLQYLLTYYLPDPSLRPLLRLPILSSIDSRAACFCHKTLQSIVYVCPLCLAIFCTAKKKCEVCAASFS